MLTCPLVAIAVLVPVLHWRAGWIYIVAAIVALTGGWLFEPLTWRSYPCGLPAERGPYELAGELADAVHRGFLVFNPPADMRQGRKERVEVGIARVAALKKALEVGLRGRGAPQWEEIETSASMVVLLEGEAFQIKGYGTSEQIVTKTAKWEFDVLPLRSGMQTLTLCVSLHIALPGLAHLGSGYRSVPVLERQVRIRVDLVYASRRFAAANWQWLIGTVVGLAVSITAWITLVR
jgi:hypothetical protein